MSETYDSIFRPDLFADQVVVITGGGSGICRGITDAFAAHGANTVITSRKQERLDEAAADVESRFDTRCLPVAADVRDEEAVQKVMSRAIDTFGRIDVLVNGAAGNFLCPAAMLSQNGYRTVLEIDAVGTFTASKAAFEAHLRDNGGCIINISATLQYLGTPMQIHAAGAKAAIDVQTRTLAVEWGMMGIRVNGIAPGPIGDTEGMKRLAPGDTRDKMETRIPLKRFGLIKEIADTALFVASPGASYMTGETVVVDGGQWIAGYGYDMMAG